MQPAVESTAAYCVHAFYGPHLGHHGDRARIKIPSSSPCVGAAIPIKMHNALQNRPSVHGDLVDLGLSLDKSLVDKPSCHDTRNVASTSSSLIQFSLVASARRPLKAVPHSIPSSKHHLLCLCYQHSHTPITCQPHHRHHVHQAAFNIGQCHCRPGGHPQSTIFVHSRRVRSSSHRPRKP